jgi:hypothetical protein
MLTNSVSMDASAAAVCAVIELEKGQNSTVSSRLVSITACTVAVVAAAAMHTTNVRLTATLLRSLTLCSF